MEASTAVAPPQRVCPKCARISWATGPRCPYCTARFRSGRGVSPSMLVAAVVIVLLGVAAMLLIAGRIVENRLDDRIATVNRDFDASLNRFRDDVRKELDARLPATGALPVPTATPFATPTPSATTTPDAGATATATATASPKGTASPTETATSTPIGRSLPGCRT
jgi:type II secretory pathway pseudopilin PulG